MDATQAIGWRNTTTTSFAASGDNGAIPRLDDQPRRQHPAGAAQQRDQGHQGHRPCQGGVLQPRRVGEGPHRPAHDRGGRAERRAQAGRHDRRADQRQHGRRARHRGPAEGLQVHLRVPRQGEHRQDQRTAGLRCRGGRLPDRRRARAPRLLLQRLRPAGARDAGGVEAGPVLQPQQPAVPLPLHRPGAVGADRGEDHPLRGGRRHRRHHLRYRPLPEGRQRRQGEGHRRRPRGLGVLRRLRAAVSRRGRR